MLRSRSGIQTASPVPLLKTGSLYIPKAWLCSFHNTLLDQLNLGIKKVDLIITINFNQYSYWEISHFQYQKMYWKWINLLGVLFLFYFLKGFSLSSSHWRAPCRVGHTQPTLHNLLGIGKKAIIIGFAVGHYSLLLL